MNFNARMYGPTARRWAVNVDHLKVQACCLLTATLILFAGCKEHSAAQDKVADKSGNDTTFAKSRQDPKVSINVNRRYDNKGNLLGFDSTYSSYYSNVQGDTLMMDSLMNSFDSYFGGDHSLLLNRKFNHMFFNDSSRYPDFFHNDFFMKRYELNDRT